MSSVRWNWLISTSEVNSISIFAFYYFIFHLKVKFCKTRGAIVVIFWAIDFLVFYRFFSLFFSFLSVFVAQVDFSCVLKFKTTKFLIFKMEIARFRTIEF